MTGYERPLWGDALRNAFLALAQQRPTPLLPLLGMLSGTVVDAAALGEFIERAADDDPAHTQTRLTLAKWDADGSPDWASAPQSEDRRSQVYEALALSPELAAMFGKHFPVFDSPATVISRVFQPWYATARSTRSNVYWVDYESYLRDVKRWSASSIASLDQTTTEVVERLSDPTRADVKQTKGLVVGYVQSGKTANFTGVAAKAVDAGFRLVVVLTGTIEILRAQTQRRMDMELIGRENILRGQDPDDPKVAKELDYQQDDKWLADEFVRHGAALDQPGVVHIDRVTTHRSDYKRLPQGLTKLRFFKTDKRAALNDPVNLFNSDAYVAVIKKNRAPLEKLLADLKPHKGDLAQLPVLIIDDESDLASVDTTNPARWKGDSAKDRERKTINRLITELLQVCPRAQYVGYTATPFANVLIDPDDERDLFPGDFVLALHRPPGYMGVREFHDLDKFAAGEPRDVSTSNELAHVRALAGDRDTDPARRDDELQEALDAWVLAGAVKKFREARGAKPFHHHTMLVHESVRRADHGDTAEDVRAIWNRSRFTSTEGGMRRLERLFDADLLPVMRARAGLSAIPKSFAELAPFIGTALAQITVDGDPILIVNSDAQVKAQQKKLDFETDQVWRILIGGTQLSRGFTVEGLTTSYFRRKPGQADTLMQAGRWFGFRPGYQDLVRLYIRRDEVVDLHDAFEALLLDEEAFRDEVRQYHGFDEAGMPLLEPRQLPLLVSQHLPWLRPTARNKMWNAKITSKATGGRFQDRYGVPDRGASANVRNLTDVAVPLLQHATRHLKLGYTLDDGRSGTEQFKVGLVPGAEFLRLISSYAWHPDYRDVVTPLKNFLATATADARITEWVIAWHQPAKAGDTLEVPGLGASPVVTRRRRADRLDFVGSDRKHATALLPIAHGRDVAELDGAPGRGVLLVYLADDRAEDNLGHKVGPLTAESLVPLLSFATPSSATPRRRDVIQWTVESKDHADEATVSKA
ncbi:endonuclease [Pseudonocardia sulfidoxydans NBRC 16205]|uniref:Endonuclease n=1 Tax=Pseudonocardia sulfidoxydans NBRC 16205 TaxID=1223511 RepID=A0A511DJ00_9PSEU|nr:Z1 domain-containing protein [Pseudonocardia sulfidoxydans]GEL24782.1 endonuclease [Pseudonocardia sulfidoxydans NBRC 16205]